MDVSCICAQEPDLNSALFSLISFLFSETLDSFSSFNFIISSFLVFIASSATELPVVAVVSWAETERPEAVTIIADNSATWVVFLIIFIYLWNKICFFKAHILYFFVKKSQKYDDFIFFVLSK